MAATCRLCLGSSQLTPVSLCFSSQYSPLVKPLAVSHSPDLDIATMERQVLSGNDLFAHSDRTAMASSTGSSLDGFLSHMMDSFGPGAAGTAAPANTSRPPLAPSATKRKRDSYPPLSADHLDRPGFPPSTPQERASVLSETEIRQASLLEKQLYSELESGLLAGFFHGPGGAAGVGALSAASPVSDSLQQSLVGGTSIRAASPNSMSIASALSMFAANCFHHYNNSLAASSATATAGLGGASTPLSSSRGVGAVPLAEPAVHSTPVPGIGLTAAGEATGYSPIAAATDISARLKEADGIALETACVRPDPMDTSTTSEESLLSNSQQSAEEEAAPSATLPSVSRVLSI